MYKSALLWTLRLSDLLNYVRRLPGISSITAQHLLNCAGIKQTEQQKKKKKRKNHPQHIAPLINPSHRPANINKTGESNKAALYTEKAAEARGFHLEGEMCTSPL